MELAWNWEQKSIEGVELGMDVRINWSWVHGRSKFNGSKREGKE